MHVDEGHFFEKQGPPQKQSAAGGCREQDTAQPGEYLPAGAAPALGSPAPVRTSVQRVRARRQMISPGKFVKRVRKNRACHD